MQKRHMVISLGWISFLISMWLFIHETNYAQNNDNCKYGPQICLAEVIRNGAISLIAISIAIIIIGTTINKSENQDED